MLVYMKKRSGHIEQFRSSYSFLTDSIISDESRGSKIGHFDQPFSADEQIGTLEVKIKARWSLTVLESYSFSSIYYESHLATSPICCIPEPHSLGNLISPSHIL